MIKILISVYIVVVLLMAGFAEAASSEETPLFFDRVAHSQKVWLNVEDARFDSRKEILTLSGFVAPECLKTIKSELQLDQRTNNILVSVTADGQECLAETKNHYVIVIDLKAYFAENVIDREGIVQFHIDNYTASEGFSFNYNATKQVQYSFNTEANGQISFDERTQKFYLVNAGSKIEILSRFNLAQYVNSFVQLKGLIPTNVSIGDEAATATSQLFIGNLIAIR